MAYFAGRSLRRNLEKVVELATFFRNSSKDFEPNLALSYLEHEDVGYYDNRALNLAVFSFRARRHRRRPENWARIPLCLFPELISGLRRYRSELKGESELCMLMEHPGLSLRTVVSQRDGDILFLRQIMKWGRWDTRDCVKVTKQQVPPFFNFIKLFAFNNLDFIKLSVARRRAKAAQWATSPPR